jgi:hypothetical protein
MRVPRWESRTWGAVVAATVSLLLLFVATGRSLWVAPLPGPEAGNDPRAVASFAHGSARNEAEVATVLRADPFHPERRAPTVRFRFPGEGLPTTNVAPVAALRLIGVALIQDGRNFALVQAGADAPRLVRVGEQIGGYTLRRVERDRAVFAGPDGKVQEYRVAKAGT